MRTLLLLLAASTLHAVTPGQVEAIISVESSGNPKAIGRLGERGLCQFFQAHGISFGDVPAGMNQCI